MNDEWTPTDEVLREKIAATVAVNDLLHSRKTWGDLLPVQKKFYLGVSDALLPIIAEVRTAALEEAGRDLLRGIGIQSTNGIGWIPADSLAGAGRYLLHIAYAAKDGAQ